MADGFFDEIEDRVKGFDKGYTIIDDLKEACLLEKGEQDNLSRSCVKMHDLLRDLAIAITRKSRQFVVKVRSNVGKFPRDENLMDDVIRVSLMYSKIELLPCQSKFPMLSTLLLEGSRLGNIDDLFFEHMQNLRVLDLSDTDITCLPQSLSNLVNLHALLLRDCESLTEVPSLVQLRELWVLDLIGTQITYLPDGMDSLTNLRCLRLSFTNLKMVPVGAISSFSHLEELSTEGSNWKWSSNENRKGRGAGVEDIVGLKHLKKLIVEFKDFSAFSSYVGSGHWRGLKCFLLAVGDGHNFNSFDVLQYNFSCRDRRVCVSGMLQQAHNMNSIAFPGSNLTELYIADSHELRTLNMEEPTGDNLANLKFIRIESCPKLKYVLSVGWFQTLQNLEEMGVYNCQAMEMVVDMGDMGEANNSITITLPRLKRLTLFALPKLKSICKRTLICSSLEYIWAYSCPRLKMLPFSINSLPSSLEQIEGSRRWWDSLEWDNANTKMHLRPFFSERREYWSELEKDQDESDYPESGSKLEEDQDFSDSPDYGVQLGEDQERQQLQFSEHPDYGFQREEDQERRGTKRKADSIGMFERPLLDLINFPPLSLVQQHGESEPRELSPRNWQLWKRHE